MSEHRVEAGLKSTVARFGFWEQAVLKPEGLVVGAWALDSSTGTAPARFRLEWGNERPVMAPNTVRPDVTGPRALGLVEIGLRATMPVAFDVHQDFSGARIVAEWEDGSETPLQPLRSLLENGLLRFLRFETQREFHDIFQNPAFRFATPTLQAYGAARAMRLAGDDLNFWLAGAVVGIYRHIDQDVFLRSEAERAIERWRVLQVHERKTAQGLRLRWATSMHLAAGYAHLAWGQFEAAREEFDALSDYTDRMLTWPQSLTNLGIARCIAAFLTIRFGDTARARRTLDGSEDMFQAGVGPLKIWNFHMYEELRGALKVWQYNFVLQKYLDGEKAPHILPPNFTFRFASVSVVLKSLIEKGLVPDWQYPGDAVPAPKVEAR